MNSSTLNGILGLISAAIPTVTNLIVAIKDANGNVSIGVLLSSADADYEKAIEAGQAWLAAHPKTATPTAAAIHPVS